MRKRLSISSRSTFFANRIERIVSPPLFLVQEVTKNRVQNIFTFVSLNRPAAPVEFPTVKFTLPTSYYLPSSSKEKLQQSLLTYLLSQQSKDSTAAKSAESIVPTSHELPDTLNNSLNNKIQGTVLNYVLPEESKDALKSTLQNSLLNYLLQQQSNHGSTFQQPSLFEAANHVPLTTIVDRPKMTLPSIPIATLPPVSRPLQAINYIPISMPKLSPFAAQDSSPGLQLGITRSSGIDKRTNRSSMARRETRLEGYTVVKRNLISSIGVSHRDQLY